MLPCHGWAEPCCLLDSSTVFGQLELASRNPLVALTQQQSSLKEINRNEMIQLLYTIDQELFGDQKEEEWSTTAAELKEI